MGYRFLEHATDAIVEVESDGLGPAMAEAAEAVAAIMLDPKTVSESERRTVRAEGADHLHLLFNWLEEITYTIVTEGFAPKSFDVDLSGDGPFRIECAAAGEPLDLSKHGFRTEVKAPTFHEMEVRAGPPVYMKFLLDL